MSLYKKLPCICGHEFDSHNLELNYCDAFECGKCWGYDPDGHNPELENVLCPNCKKARLERPIENLYTCLQCKYAASEAVILRIVG